MNEVMFQAKLKSCKELLTLQSTATMNILEKRLIFKRLNEIIKSNHALKNTYNLFWDWYFYNYVDSQIMEIMRILDQDPSSKNLIKFLDSLVAGQQIDGAFFEQVRSAIKSDTLSPDQIRSLVPIFSLDELKKDKEDLINNSTEVKDYRDAKVAHHEPQKWSGLDLDLKKLDDCIDFLHARILRYELCINGGYLESLLPNITYDWESIFRIPWIESVE